MCCFRSYYILILLLSLICCVGNENVEDIRETEDASDSQPGTNTDSDIDMDSDNDTDSDTDTDSDGDADVDASPAVCVAGDCCNTTTGQYRPDSYECSSYYEYQCSGSNCGDDVEQRVVNQFCSGTSAICDGRTEHGGWSTFHSCDNNYICVPNGSNPGNCQQCIHGCDGGVCYPECEPSVSCCDSGGRIVCWYDPTSGFMWEDLPSMPWIPWDEAVSYCEDLILDEYDDWSLPTISQLRSLISGCDKTDSNGGCTVTDTCLSHPSCTNNDCLGCETLIDDYYWDPALRKAVSDTLHYWSSSSVQNITSQAWMIVFTSANVNVAFKTSSLNVRCMRQ